MLLFIIKTPYVINKRYKLTVWDEKNQFYQIVNVFLISSIEKKKKNEIKYDIYNQIIIIIIVIYYFYYHHVGITYTSF